MTKEQEIMNYLCSNVFDPVLNSPEASSELKAGVRLTIYRMQSRDAVGMVHYYWSAVQGTERSTSFARRMKAEGFTRFEEVLEDFRDKFNDKWLSS